MLSKEQAVLVVIDIQGKLAQVVHEPEVLAAQVEKLIQGCRLLELPVLWLEQIPEKLGPSIPEVSRNLEGLTPIAKSCFSCCGSADFMSPLKASGRKQVLLCGIETHVCVYQTAMELVEQGFEVEVVSDAVSSRDPENKKLAVRKMQAGGVGISCVEMALFELCKVAGGDKFKALLKIIK